MNEQTINEILAGLPFPPTQNEADVSPMALSAKAYHMAKRGYIHSRTSLAALELYLKGYALLLSGPVGVGKSKFFQCVEPDGGVPMLSFNACVLWKYDELHDWLTSTRNEDIVIDDLGWDRSVGSGISNNYGTKYDALQIVLDYRLGKSANRTHITTNLDNDGLIKAYDYHLVDRIYELCKPVVWNVNEPSRRAAAPNRLAVAKYSTPEKEK